MRISGRQVVAALGLPRVLIVALSMIVGGDCTLMSFPTGERSDASPRTSEIMKRRLRRSCGPVALKLVFEHYGIQRSLDEITARVAPGVRGSSMLTLKNVAEENGFLVEGWKLGFDDLRNIPYPAIAYVCGNHFIVLDSVTYDGNVYFRDARGATRMTRGEFLRDWKGETLVLRK